MAKKTAREKKKKEERLKKRRETKAAKQASSLQPSKYGTERMESNERRKGDKRSSREAKGQTLEGVPAPEHLLSLQVDSYD